MDPHQAFCPTLDCPARGQTGQGNILSHGRKRPRFRCTVCGKTFSPRHNTPLYRRRTPEDIILLVVTLLAHGCPIAAIEVAFGLQARTVRDWLAAAGEHARAIQQEKVEQPQDLVHVQADELRVTTQSGVVWMAMAMMVPTRLWLGGIVSKQRDFSLILHLAQLIGRCARRGALLLSSDGLASYPTAFARVFRTPQRTGQRGAPRPGGLGRAGRWCKLIKAGRGTVGMMSRLVRGSGAAVVRGLMATAGCQVVSTAYIERLNGTFRSRLASLARRTRGLARQQASLERGMYLVGVVYNFCTFHQSLMLKDGSKRTPAMAAGLSDHRWSVQEMLRYRVPPPRWQPPKRRGRRSKRLQALIERWCPDAHH